MQRRVSPLELRPGMAPGLLPPGPLNFGQPGALGVVPPEVPGPRRQGIQCNEADRVTLAGGALNTLLVHSAITPFERLWRIEPEPGMFDESVSPDNPYVTDVGAFIVPGEQDLLVTDLRPDIYRYTGISASDTVPVEARRFSTLLGFELLVDGQHPGNIELEVVPLPPNQNLAFAPPLGAPVAGFAELAANGLDPFTAFNVARSQQQQSAPGVGLSLLPQRPTRYGPLSIPFTLYARGSQVVRVRFVVIQPIPSPIAFIEYDLSGMLLPSQWVTTMEECMKPLSNASGGPGSLGGGPR